MISTEVLEYEAFRKALLRKGMKVIKQLHPKRFVCSNHFPLFVEEGIYFPTHDGEYMQGNILVTWEGLGL